MNYASIERWEVVSPESRPRTLKSDPFVYCTFVGPDFYLKTSDFLVSLYYDSRSLKKRLEDAIPTTNRAVMLDREHYTKAMRKFQVYNLDWLVQFVKYVHNTPEQDNIRIRYVIEMLVDAYNKLRGDVYFADVVADREEAKRLLRETIDKLVEEYKNEI